MYLEFFGLREEPFRLTPDPRFFHLAQPHREALIGIFQLISLRRGMAAVTGPIGTGKTTILHTCLQVATAKFKDKLQTALLINPLLTPAEFFEYVIDELGITGAGTSKPRRIMALQQHAAETQARGGTTVLVIDEAHLLSPELLEEIRLLGNLDLQREKMIQILLSGQPELDAVLERPEMAALKQRLCMRLCLRSLSRSETGSYIGERLQAAGLKGSSPFRPDVVDALYAFSTGVPRVINLLADSAMRTARQRNSRMVEVDVVELAAAELRIEPPGRERQELPPEVCDNSSPVEVLRAALRAGAASGSKPKS